MILGNLDYETQLARQAGIQIELPKRVRKMLAGLSTLMAALGNDGDELWTMEPVDGARLGADLPEVRLVNGECASPVAVAWGDMTAARWNNRRFHFELGEALGSNHPRTRIVDSLAELEAHIADDDWVVKAPLSASGRFRLRRRGALDTASRKRAARLLSQFGELLFEPWVQRTADYGCVGHVSADSVSLRSPHVLVVDKAGVFRGIDLSTPTDHVATPLTDVARRVGQQLHGEGYRGPFGIDSYAFIGADGEPGLRAFCELNARHSFGHIAWAISDRVGERLRLFVDHGEPPDSGRVVLAPGVDDPTCSWWEPEAA